MKYILSLLSLAALPAMAQMENTVEVETSVTPVVKDANKINVLPEVLESEAYHNKVSYSSNLLQTKKYVFTPVDMLAASATDDAAGKGFLSAGAGLPGNLDFRAAYGFNLSKNDVLGIHFSVDGYDGKAYNDKLAGKSSSLPGTSPVVNKNYKSRFYTTRGGADYTHKYANGLSEFFINFGLESQAFNYQYPMAEATDKQNNSLGHISLGSTDFRSATGFHIGGAFTFDFFNQKYLTNSDKKYSESILDINTDFGYFLNEDNSLNMGFELINCSYMEGIKGHTVLHLTPNYYYSDYDWSLKLGLFIGTDGNFAPDVKFNYHITDNTDFYAQVSGYENINTFRIFSALSPYFCLPVINSSSVPGSKKQDIKIESEFHQIDANIGIRFRSDNGWSGNANIGYDKSKNRAEFQCIYTGASTAKIPTIGFTDGGRFYMNLDLVYNHNNKVKFDLKNQFNAWSMDKDNKDKLITTRPVLNLDWNVDFCISKGLFLGVDWKLMSFKNTKTKSSPIPTTATDEKYKRPTTCDVGLTAHYAFSNTPLSLYANVDNLFNMKYDKFYTYRAPGTNFILGLAYTF